MYTHNETYNNEDMNHPGAHINYQNYFEQFLNESSENKQENRKSKINKVII